MKLAKLVPVGHVCARSGWVRVGLADCGFGCKRMACRDCGRVRVVHQADTGCSQARGRWAA